jgi:hypothetical protein
VRRIESNDAVDRHELELATVSGSVSGGMTATLTVAV